MLVFSPSAATFSRRSGECSGFSQVSIQLAEGAKHAAADTPRVYCSASPSIAVTDRVSQRRSTSETTRVSNRLDRYPSDLLHWQPQAQFASVIYNTVDKSYDVNSSTVSAPDAPTVGEKKK